MPPLRRLALLALALLLTGLAAAPVERGAIGDAQFAIARPDGPWNGNLLLLAHGYRAENSPLVADLATGHAAYQALLDEGWIVAATSYRRNGLILVEAMEDLDALLAHLTATCGSPRHVLLEGESMGGTIVTNLLERPESPYDGGIAIGAALDLSEPDGRGRVNGRPQRPLLFLTNQSEWSGPHAYALRAGGGAGVIPPVLFRVARDGHVNVNQAERLVALRALIAWVEHGKAQRPPGRPDDPFEATRPPQPLPSRVEPLPGEAGFSVAVREVSAIYGNVWLEAQPADFASAGIAPGTDFELRTATGRQRVRYGSDFNSVGRGEWVAFPNADGFFWLARNYAHAANSAGLSAGQRVEIRPYPRTD